MEKIFITGASSGLGFALADYFHTIGHPVVSCARRDIECSWQHIPNIDVSDLTNLKYISEHLRGCDYLINNVGMAYDGILATQGEESILKMIDVNLSSVIVLTKYWIRFNNLNLIF